MFYVHLNLVTFGTNRQVCRGCQVALGDIVVAVLEADLPPRTFDRNGMGPFVPSLVQHHHIWILFDYDWLRPRRAPGH
jgi:hypothetical protein